MLVVQNEQLGMKTWQEKHLRAFLPQELLLTRPQMFVTYVSRLVNARRTMFLRYLFCQYLAV